MRLTPFLAVGLVSTAAARSVGRRSAADAMSPDVAEAAPVVNLKMTTAPMDASAIAKLLTNLNTGFKGINTAIKGITKDNAKTQMDQVQAASAKMNTLLLQSAATIKGSPPFGNLLTAISLLSPAKGLITTLNTTIQATIEKRPIILEAKLTDKVKASFTANKPGIVALVLAIPGQLPANAKSSLEGAIGGPINLTEAQVGPVVDRLIDIIIGIFDGTTDLSQLGKGLGKGKAPGGAAPPAEGAAPPSTPDAMTGGAAPAAPPAATPDPPAATPDPPAASEPASSSSAPPASAPASKGKESKGKGAAPAAGASPKGGKAGGKTAGAPAKGGKGGKGKMSVVEELLEDDEN